MHRIMFLFVAAFVVLGASAASPQGGSEKEQTMVSQQSAKEFRSSGTIVRSSKEKSSLTVLESRSKIERTVIYNSSTKWTKGKEPADMKEFKDGSSVICLGQLNEKGELVATRIDLQ